MIGNWIRAGSSYGEVYRGDGRVCETDIDLVSSLGFS